MDITKCSGDGCPIKDKCFRFTSEGEPLYQSYFTEIPGKWEDDQINKKVWECDVFWSEPSTRILNQLKEIMK